MTEDLKKAIEIADKLEDGIAKIHPSLSYLSITKLAEFTAMAIKQEIPMYIGNLNPKWKIYDDVVTIIKGRNIPIVVSSKNKPNRTSGDFDVWYKPCTRCGYDTAKSAKPKDGNKTCWRCGNFVQRDYTERALKK